MKTTHFQLKPPKFGGKILEIAGKRAQAWAYRAGKIFKELIHKFNQYEVKNILFLAFWRGGGG